MRTLSARILLGFIALMISFGTFVVAIVMNLREVEDQASLILRGYVPLAITAADLAQLQDSLLNYLDQGIADESRPNDAASTLATLRKKRGEALGHIVATLDELPRLVAEDSQAAAQAAKQTVETGRKVDELERLVNELTPLYATLTSAPQFRTAGRPTPPPAIDDHAASAHQAGNDALAQLRQREKEISRRVGDLRDTWKRHTTLTKHWLADNERTILMRAIYSGAAAVVLGLAITAWVALSLRSLLRLREGARRIAAGDYGKRIPETGPTEIADLAREFNSMGRAVQEREEEKLRAARLAMVGKMAAQIAHEVRNPLSSIGLNTELIEDELGDDAGEARELCRKIHAEVNRLTELTETYLGLRGGKPKLARESLNTVVGDLVGFVRQDLANRQVDLATELDPGDPTVSIDANQIRQCLINLVRNAADAVSENGGGRVVVRTRGAADRVEIAVADDGVGIPADLLPRLFDPFYSTKKNGNGLGLALTQQIVRDHGGDIQVASRVGRGTTFTLSIPSG